MIELYLSLASWYIMSIFEQDNSNDLMKIIHYLEFHTSSSLWVRKIRNRNSVIFTLIGIGEMVSCSSIWFKFSANVVYGSVLVFTFSFVCWCVDNCTVKFGKLPVQILELLFEERVDEDADGDVRSLLNDSPSERRSGTLTPWIIFGFLIIGVGNLGMFLNGIRSQWKSSWTCSHITLIDYVNISRNNLKIDEVIVDNNDCS